MTDDVLPPLDMARAVRHAEERKEGNLTSPGEWDESTETGNLARAFLKQALEVDIQTMRAKAFQAHLDAISDALPKDRDRSNPLVSQVAAEIERLTRERDEWRTASFRMEALYRNCREALALTSSDEAKAATARAEASEARAAALEPYEKLALQLTDACVRWGWGHCTAGPELIGQIDSEIARAADLLKALERAEKPHAPGCSIGHGYKSHGRTKPMERVEHPCTCGLAAAMQGLARAYLEHQPEIERLTNRATEWEQLFRKEAHANQVASIKAATLIAALEEIETPIGMDEAQDSIWRRAMSAVAKIISAAKPKPT